MPLFIHRPDYIHARQPPPANISAVSPRDMGTQRQKTAVGDGASRCSPRGKKPIAYGWAGGKQELVPYGLAGAGSASNTATETASEASASA